MSTRDGAAARAVRAQVVVTSGQEMTASSRHRQHPQCRFQAYTPVFHGPRRRVHTLCAQGVLDVVGRPAVDPSFAQHFLQQALVVDPSVSHDVLLVVEDLIVAQVCGGNLPGIKRSCALSDLRGVVIALCDLGPAFGVFIGQHRFVVRTVFPFDGDHVAVVAGIPCGDLRFVEFMPPCPVEQLRIPDVAPRNQGILPALVVARVLPLQFRYVAVMGGITLVQRDHPVVMPDRAAILFDFARIVTDGRVVRFDLVDRVILRERIGTGDPTTGLRRASRWFS